MRFEHVSHFSFLFLSDGLRLAKFHSVFAVRALEVEVSIVLGQATGVEHVSWSSLARKEIHVSGNRLFFDALMRVR